MTIPEPQAMGEDDSAEQDKARADVYAVIGRLFYDAPDQQLLATLTEGLGEHARPQGKLGVAWNDLCVACKTAFPGVLKQEFDNLFVGVGKSEITPYTSHYVKYGVSGTHLVRLRELMTEWKLQRRVAANETEDHAAGVIDVMRHLISDGYGYDQQRMFFKEFIYSGLLPMCDAIDRSPNANFYRRVAQFVRAFLAVEADAFELLDD